MKALCQAMVLLAFALSATFVVAQKAEGKKYALLVGVKDYDHNDLSPLKYTEHDANALATVLRANGYEVRVLTSTRGKTDKADLPTTANIRKAMVDLMEGKTRRDSVLIALSGHGIQLELEDPEGRQRTRRIATSVPPMPISSAPATRPARRSG